MHFTALTAIAALAISSAPSLAVPLVTNTNPSRALTSRSQFCYNAPNVIAGTPLNRRTFSPNTLMNGQGALPVDRQTWCATGTRTYIVVTYVYDLPAPFPQMLISDAQAQVDTAISAVGDSVIPGGEYSLQEEGLEVVFRNANNHQCTWGVVGAALRALKEFMESLRRMNGGHYGAVSFVLVDGFIEVGTGALQYA